MTIVAVQAIITSYLLIAVYIAETGRPRFVPATFELLRALVDQVIAIVTIRARRHAAQES